MLALSSLASVGALAALMEAWGGASWPFGFQVHWTEPLTPLDPELPPPRCGNGYSGGPMSQRWTEGPSGRFEQLDPGRLARESLAWFEASPEAATWKAYPDARLELTYPSGALLVTARCAPDLGLSWEQQLRAWFERFPPGGDGGSLGSYGWGVAFGDTGAVDGSAWSDASALKRMKALLEGAHTSPIFGEPSFSMGLAVRSSSNATNVYGVEVEAADELDDLPVLLREQIAQSPFP